MLLVTGITGHTGRYLLQELIDNKYEGTIRCVVRKCSDTSLLDNSGLNIEKVIGSLDNQDFIESIMIGVDTVMHIYNIHHSPMIVKAAIKNSVIRAILVHTTGIYSKFKYASQAYKEIENKVSELTKGSNHLTRITILRPTMIYGDLCDHNMSKFINLVDKFRIMPVVNRGTALIQPVNARDLGKVFFNVLGSLEVAENKAYDLSGEKPIKVIDVLKLISKELNKKTVFISVPLSFGIFSAKVLNALTLGKINYIEKIQRMGEDRSYSHDDATIDFGYNPMSFEEGIHIEVQEYLKEFKTMK